MDAKKHLIFPRKCILSFVLLLSLFISFNIKNINTDNFIQFNNVVYADETKHAEDVSSLYTESQYQQAIIEANNAVNNKEKVPSAIQDIINQGIKEGIIVKKGAGNYKLNDNIKSKKTGTFTKGENNLWTGYAQFIMGTGIKGQDTLLQDFFTVGKKAFSNPVGSKIKSGSSFATFGLGELSEAMSGKLGSTDAYGWNSRMISSFLGTFTGYNYIQTEEGSRFINASWGDKITSFLAQITLTFNTVAESLNALLSKALLALNPFSWFGYHSNNYVENNPFSKAIKTFFESLGVDKEIITLILNGTATILIFVLIFFLLRGISKGNLNYGKSKLKNYALRIVLLLIFFPLMANLTNTISQSLYKTVGKTSLFSSSSDQVVKHVLLDVEDWAISQNLSPTALSSSNPLPNAHAGDNYVDKNFKPSIKRGLINEINDKSKMILGNALEYSTGSDLLEAWSESKTFDINSYVSGIKNNESKDLAAFSGNGSTRINDGGRNVPAFKYDTDSKDNSKSPYIIASNLGSYIWGITDFKQTLGSNSGKEMEKAHKTSVYNYKKEKTEGDIKFKETENYGVDNNQSFSTQSVALMLQTSFNGKSAIFKTSNISNTGAYVSSVLSANPVSWRSVTMPSENMVSSFANRLYLVAFLIAGFIINLGVFLSLWHSGVFTGVKNLIFECSKFAITGDYGYAVGFVSYYIAIIVLGLFTMNLSSILVTLLMSITSTLAGLLQNLHLAWAGSFIDIITSIAGIIFAMYLSGITLPFNLDKIKDSPIATLMNLPFKKAKEITKNAHKHSAMNNKSSGVGLGFGKYTSNSDKGNSDSSFSHKAKRNDFANAQTEDGAILGGELGRKLKEANERNNSSNDKFKELNPNANNYNSSENNNLSKDKLNNDSKDKLDTNLNDLFKHSDVLDRDKQHSSLNGNENNSNGNNNSQSSLNANNGDNEHLSQMGLYGIPNGGINGNKDKIKNNSVNGTDLLQAEKEMLERPKTSKFSETTARQAEKIVRKLSDDTISRMSLVQTQDEMDSLLLSDLNGAYVASQNNIAKQSIYDEEENPNRLFLSSTVDENGDLNGYDLDRDEFDKYARMSEKELEEEIKEGKESKENIQGKYDLAKKAFSEGSNAIFNETRSKKSELLNDDEYRERIARGLVSGLGTHAYLRNQAKKLPTYISNTPYLGQMYKLAKNTNKAVLSAKTGDAKGFVTALNETKTQFKEIKENKENAKINKQKNNINKQNKEIERLDKQYIKSMEKLDKKRQSLSEKQKVLDKIDEREKSGKRLTDLDVAHRAIATRLAKKDINAITKKENFLENYPSKVARKQDKIVKAEEKLNILDTAKANNDPILATSKIAKQTKDTIRDAKEITKDTISKMQEKDSVRMSNLERQMSNRDEFIDKISDLGVNRKEASSLSNKQLKDRYIKLKREQLNKKD